MNKCFILFIFSIIIGQPQKAEGVLKIIQKNAISIDKKKGHNMEKIFSQAKSLERSGLYEEAFSLFKEINREKTGVNKYFKPLKNYLKQIYTKMMKMICRKDTPIDGIVHLHDIDVRI